MHLHLRAAILAIVLGPVALYRRRRDVWHRIAGYTRVGAMALVAGGSFWLEPEVLPIAFGFGAIHLLSVIVLVGLLRGAAAARAGDAESHSAWMRGLYWHSLIVAGTLTLLPGRTLNTLLFPGTPQAGLVAIAVIAGALLSGWRVLQLRTRHRSRPGGG